MNLEKLQNKLEMLEVSLDGVSERLTKLEEKGWPYKMSKPAFKKAFVRAVAKVEERNLKNGVSKV